MPSTRSKLKKLVASSAAVGVLLLFMWRCFIISDSSVDFFGKTLVVHIFADTDPEYLENLKFFVHYGILKKDIAAEYVIIVQSDTSATLDRLPALPANARYVVHPNECYDWGAVGWLLLRSGEIDLAKFRYIVITNSSVRGPFLPPYIPVSLTWHRLLTQRLSDTIKLVGPIISCEGAAYRGNISGQWRTNPHVQSYVLAMDKEALQILEREGDVLQCHKDRWDAIFFGELGSSLAILKAGLSIDSFVIRYQHIDWRQPKNWGCNAGLNPTGNLYFDGTSLHPYDAMFVKMKKDLVQGKTTTTTHALRYQHWMDTTYSGRRNVNSNEFVAHINDIRAPLISSLRARGAHCWDADFYMDQYPDLRASGMAADEAWEHFVNYGQFEDRVERLTCDPYKAV